MRITFIILLFGFFSHSQNPDIVNYDEIYIDGISNKSTESELIVVFGKPNLITKPNYACGALSPEWNDVDVTLYEWDGIEIHCVDGKFEIGQINYLKANPKIKTPQLTITKFTTLSELQKAFPNSYKIWRKQNKEYDSKILILWPNEFSDSEFHIIIENEKITEFKLYHPC